MWRSVARSTGLRAIGETASSVGNGGTIATPAGQASRRSCSNWCRASPCVARARRRPPFAGGLEGSPRASVGTRPSMPRSSPACARDPAVPGLAGRPEHPPSVVVMRDHPHAVAGHTGFVGAPSATRLPLALRPADWRRSDPARSLGRRAGGPPSRSRRRLRLHPCPAGRRASAHPHRPIRVWASAGAAAEMKRSLDKQATAPRAPLPGQIGKGAAPPGPSPTLPDPDAAIAARFPAPLARPDRCRARPCKRTVGCRTCPGPLRIPIRCPSGTPGPGRSGTTVSACRACAPTIARFAGDHVMERQDPGDRADIRGLSRQPCDPLGRLRGRRHAGRRPRGHQGPPAKPTARLRLSLRDGPRPPSSPPPVIGPGPSSAPRSIGATWTLRRPCAADAPPDPHAPARPEGPDEASTANHEGHARAVRRAAPPPRRSFASRRGRRHRRAAGADRGNGAHRRGALRRAADDALHGSAPPCPVQRSARQIPAPLRWHDEGVFLGCRRSGYAETRRVGPPWAAGPIRASLRVTRPCGPHPPRRQGG